MMKSRARLEVVGFLFVTIALNVANAQPTTSCSPTMADTISNPTTGASLASTWLEALNYGSLLDSTLLNITAFSPMDFNQLEAVQVYNDWRPQNGTNSNNYLATVLLYNAVRGTYSPDELVAAGSINTLLGEVKGKDIMLSFVRDETGSVVVTGQGLILPATINSEVQTCNGNLYLTDTLLLPTAKSSDIEPVVLKSGQYSNLLMNANSCGSNFIGYASNVSSAEYVQMMNSTGLGAILGSPDFAGTVILPRQLSPALLNDSDAFVKTVLYNTLPGSFCPSELAKAGSMNTVLGNLTNASVPITFKKGKGGNLTIASSQTVQSYRTLCNKVVLVVDDLAPLPQAALKQKNTYITANDIATKIKSLPPRRLTCNVTSYDDMLSSTSSTSASTDGTPSANENTSSNSSSADTTTSTVDGTSQQQQSTSNTGVIVGATIGGVAALALIITAIILLRKRNKQQLETDSPIIIIKQSSSESPPRSFSFASSILPIIKKRNKLRDSAGDGSSNSIQIKVIPNNNDMNTARVDMMGDDFDFDKSSDDDNGDNGALEHVASRSLKELFKTHSGLSSMYIERKDISIDRDEMKQRVLLGSGSYGYVYRGMLRNTTEIAAKILICPGIAAEKAFLMEAKILQSLDQTNSNVVRILGISLVTDRLVLIMELMKGGDLRAALDNDTEGLLDWNRCGKRIALDIVRGLVSLHESNVIHRDLKSKNILLTSQDENTMVAKLADVGVAALATSGYLSATNNVVGTLAWSAPELLLGERCNAKVDVYSLGIVLWEIVTKQVPKRGFVAMPAPSEKAPKELIDLILLCTNKYAFCRPTAQEVYDKLIEMM